MAEPQSQGDPKQNEALGCLVRLHWMAFGNAVVIFSLLLIVRNRAGFLSVLDAVFWAAVASMLIMRYVDIRHLHGCTTTGEPASMADWRRYALVLALVSAVAWLLAHAFVRCGWL